MYIAPHDDFSFLHMNKTGGRSIIKFLTPRLKNFYSLGAPFVHKPLKEVIGFVMGSRILTSIRNPYDRYESLYFYRRMKYDIGHTGGQNVVAHDLKFEDWMEDVLNSDLHTNHTQTELLEPWPENLHCVRLEHLREDLCKFLGWPCNLYAMPHINKSIRGNVEWPKLLRQHVFEADRRIFDLYKDMEDK